jgi:tetratricopeptide (TPR) repeat protein
LAYSRLDEALRITKENFGPDHPHMFTTMGNIALTHEAAGKQEEAITMLEQVAVSVEKRKFDHTLAGRHLSNFISRLEESKRYNQAEIWRRKWLAVIKERAGAESVAYAAELRSLAINLLQQKNWSDAEAIAQEGVKIGQQKEPDAWTTFHAQSLVGAALAGQKRYADAVPLLLHGYQGMKSREATIPKILPTGARGPSPKAHLIEALERLVELYEAWGKEAEATKWKAELAEVKGRQK